MSLFDDQLADLREPLPRPLFNGRILLTDQKSLRCSLIFAQLYDNNSRPDVILIVHTRLASLWYLGKYKIWAWAKTGTQQVWSAKTGTQQVWSIQFIFYVIYWQLIEGDQAQYGVLNKDSKYAWSFYSSSHVMILQIIWTRCLWYGIILTQKVYSIFIISISI